MGKGLWNPSGGGGGGLHHESRLRFRGLELGSFFSSQAAGPTQQWNYITQRNLSLSLSSHPRLGSFHAAREHGDRRESRTIQSAHPLFMDSEQTPTIVSPDLCLLCVFAVARRRRPPSPWMHWINIASALWALTSFWVNRWHTSIIRAGLPWWGFLTPCAQACKRRSQPPSCECTGPYFQPQPLNL